MKRLAALALILALCLSACGTANAGPSPTPEATPLPTATPVPVEEASSGVSPLCTAVLRELRHVRSSEFRSEDDEWQILSRTAAEPPQYGAAGARIENSVITEGCVIEGTVINSVLSSGVTVEKGAVVKDSVIMRDTVIGENSRVEYAIIDENVIVGKECVIGEEKREDNDVTVIGAKVKLSDGVQIEPGTIYSEKGNKGGEE